MGFVRTRSSRTRSTSQQSVAVLAGAPVQLGTSRPQQLAASTRTSGTSHVRAHLIPRFGAVPVADITRR